MLAEVEQGIVRCFRDGGGLSYADYPRFHTLMAEDSRAFVDAALLDAVVPLVDGLPDRLRAGIDVADIGCGSGHAINVLARAYPNSRFTGFDFSEEAISRRPGRGDGARVDQRAVRGAGRGDAGQPGRLRPGHRVRRDPRPGAPRRQVLAAIARALRPDGTFLMVDIRASSNVEENLEHPLAPFLYTVSTMHCMSVSLGLDGDGWARPGASS